MKKLQIVLRLTEMPRTIECRTFGLESPQPQFCLEIETLPGGSQILRLRKDGETQLGKNAERQTLKLLVYLTEHAQEVIERKQLFKDIWTKHAEQDANINLHVGRLRKLFGDDSKEPRFIETIDGVGVKFLLPVAISREPTNNEDRKAGLLSAYSGVWHCYHKTEDLDGELWSYTRLDFPPCGDRDQKLVTEIVCLPSLPDKGLSDEGVQEFRDAHRYLCEATVIDRRHLVIQTMKDDGNSGKSDMAVSLFRDLMPHLSRPWPAFTLITHTRGGGYAVSMTIISKGQRLTCDDPAVDALLAGAEPGDPIRDPAAVAALTKEWAKHLPSKTVSLVPCGLGQDGSVTNKDAIHRQLSIVGEWIDVAYVDCDGITHVREVAVISIRHDKDGQLSVHGSAYGQDGLHAKFDSFCASLRGADLKFYYESFIGGRADGNVIEGGAHYSFEDVPGSVPNEFTGKFFEARSNVNVLVRGRRIETLQDREDCKVRAKRWTVLERYMKEMLPEHTVVLDSPRRDLPVQQSGSQFFGHEESDPKREVASDVR